MPEGLQIILLPANLSLEGLPASMAIPASFIVPQQLQSYSYILTDASDPLPVLPAGFNASSPSTGALLWRPQALAWNPCCNACHGSVAASISCLGALPKSESILLVFCAVPGTLHSTLDCRYFHFVVYPSCS